METDIKGLSQIRRKVEALQEALKTWTGSMLRGISTVKEAVVVNGTELSHSDIRDMLSTAIEGRQSVGVSPEMFPYVWVRDVYDGWCVYEADDESTTYRRTYEIDTEGKVTLGDPAEVIAQRTYTPVAEGAVFPGGFVPLLERSLGPDNTIPLKLIQPGWGSSGYYPADVLERDGPEAFTSGLKMYWNHPTATEAVERPERDLRDLAAELTGDARWEPQGAAGPGLYAEAVVFEPYRAHIEELAPHIGVSIRALGQATKGSAEGQDGAIVERIVSAHSVDFVTEPGAGGQIVQLFESARTHTEVVKMSMETEKKLTEANTTLTETNTTLTAANVAIAEELATLQEEAGRLREAELFRAAEAFVLTSLPANIPDLTRERLTKTLAARPLVKDGKIDEAAFKESIDATVAAELEYLTKIAGVSGGKVSDLGRPDPSDGKAQLKEAYLNLYLKRGESEAQAEQMATAAAQGR